jgi:hypothetical protein
MVNFIFSPILSEDQHKLNYKRLFPVKNKCRLRTFYKMFKLNAEILLTCSDAGFHQILHEM